MKLIPPTSRRFSRRLLTALAFAQVSLLASAHAATVTLTASDPNGATTSYNTGLNWSDGQAPSSANDYLVTGGLLLQGPAAAPSSSTTFTFGGNSLTLGNGTTTGVLTSQAGNGNVIYQTNNLILNNGIIRANSGVGTFTGNALLQAGGGTVDQASGGYNLTVSDVFSGTGTLTLTNSGGSTGAGQITLGNLNTYTGATVIQANTRVLAQNSFATSSSLTLSGSGASINLNTGSPTFNNLSGVAGTSIDAKISSGGVVITVNQTVDGTYAGTFINSGTSANVNLTKTGSATLTLSGVNTYASATAVNNGTLRLDANTGSIASTSALNLGGGTLLYDNTNTTGGNKTQTFASVSAVAGGSRVQSTLGGASSATLTITAAPAVSTGATLNFVTSGGTNGSTNSIVLAGTTSAGVLNYQTFFNGGDLAYVNAAGGFVRAPVYDTDANFANATALAPGSATTNYQFTTSATATNALANTLKFSGSGAVNLALSGTIVLTNGTIIRAGGGSTTISGGTSIATSATSVPFVIDVASATDSLTISTPLIGGSPTRLIKTGDGTLTFGTSNNYNGQTYIDGGVLSISGNTLGLAAGGQQVNINNATLQGTATLSLGNVAGGAPNRAIVITNTATFDVTGANIMTVPGVVSGTGALTKTSSGILSLTAANTYTGATTVNAGSLFVSGSTAAGSAVTVNNAGTILGGNGTIAGRITVGNGATLMAGNTALATPTVGTLTTGALTLQTGSTFNALLASNTSFSTLSSAGTTALGNAAFTISLTSGATFTDGSVLELITSPVTGQFTNSTYTAGGYNFAADYTTNAGFFSVDVTAVPEPSTWAAGLMLTAFVVVEAVRRKRKAA